MTQPTNTNPQQQPEATREQLMEQLVRADDMLQTIAAQREQFANQNAHLNAELRSLQRKLAAYEQPQKAMAMPDAPHDELPTPEVAANKLNGKKNGAHASK